MSLNKRCTLRLRRPDVRKVSDFPKKPLTSFAAMPQKWWRSHYKKWRQTSTVRQASPHIGRRSRKQNIFFSSRLLIVIFSLCILSSCGFYSTSIPESKTQPTPTPQSKSRLGVYVPQIPSMLNRTQTSEHFSARFSSRSKKADVDSVLKILEDARKKMAEHLSNASLNIDEVPVCVIIIHDSTGNFTSDTNQPWQVGAVTRGLSITVQPVDVLRKRNSLESILRHEYVHVIINALRQKQLPRWLNEGTALYYSGEGATLVKTVKRINLSLDELEKKLDSSPSSDEMRQLYAASFREVSVIIAKEGEAGLWKRITLP